MTISKAQKWEIALHLLLWLFYFICINVDWTVNWWDSSLRPNTPAPLSVLIFPLFCYVNAMWLVPRYFNLKDWPRYLLFGSLIFLLPELLRAGLVGWLDPQISFSGAVMSRDSFIFGAPSAFFLAMNASFGYRFTKDWLFNRPRVQEWKQRAPRASGMEKSTTLPTAEAEQLMSNLQQLMDSEQVYLDPQLSLRGLAYRMSITDKKLSQLLNQHLHTNFYDYVNAYRIALFKEKLHAGMGQQYSIVGMATECGFRSKSSFYRAFRKQVGLSPTEYLGRLSA